MDGVECNAAGNACKRHVAIFCSYDWLSEFICKMLKELFVTTKFSVF